MLQTAASAIVGEAAFALRTRGDAWLGRQKLAGVGMSPPALAQVQGHVYQLVRINGLPRRRSVGRRIAVMGRGRHIVCTPPRLAKAYALVVSVL